MVADRSCLINLATLTQVITLINRLKLNPGETQNIKVATPDSGYFSMARFNYHTQDNNSTEQPNGCYISVIEGNEAFYDETQNTNFQVLVSSISTSPEKKLGCIASVNRANVLIYDDSTLALDSVCSDPFKCISYVASHDDDDGNNTNHVFSLTQLKHSSCNAYNMRIPIDPINNYQSILLDCGPE